jgi:site-specific DNA-cytosine methylase
VDSTYISLYAGGGGLDMGFHRAVPNAQCVAYVEHEASAAALLVDHIEAELLDAAPVYTDAYTFPAERFHGLVDWVIGGPPCQPFSIAGKQLGADDPRNLWPLTLRMVEQIQPRGCFFENVSSRKSLWYIYEQVLPGLRHLGYEVEAGIFSAAEVGAPHNRQRVFILAYRNDGHDQPAIRQVCTGRHTVDCSDTELADTGSQQWDGGRDTEKERVHPAIGQTACGDEQWADRLHRAGEGSATVGDTSSEGRERSHNNGEPPRRLHEVTGERCAELDNPNNTRRRQGNAEDAGRPPKQLDGSDGTVADTNRARLQTRIQPGSLDPQGRQEPHGQSSKYGDIRNMADTIGQRGRSGNSEWQDAAHAFPPGPRGDWSNVPERLWPAVKPGFRDVADGLAGRVAALSRAQELRILGNGVVPQTAEKAFNILKGM